MHDIPFETDPTEEQPSPTPPGTSEPGEPGEPRFSPLSEPPPSSSSGPAPLFAGVPEALVRSLMRHSGREGVSQESLTGRLGEAAPQVLEELVSRGFLGATPVGDRYPHTARGREWTEALPDKLYRLGSAQRAVDALLRRVRTMNAQDHALFTVERVIVFGELLTAPEVLRSVEVGIDLVRAPSAQKRASEGADQDRRADRRKTTPAEWLAARERGVWTFLGDRSPVLRLLPLAGDAWPHGVELYPTQTAPGLLTAKPRRR